MPELKINKKPVTQKDDFDVIPNEEIKSSSSTIIKEENSDEGRKLFANKKANKALIIAGIVIAAIIIGLVIFINVPIG